MSAEEEIIIVPLRVGIRFSPPALVFVYEKKSGDILVPGVLRRRIMPIRDFNQSFDIECIARELLERHGQKLFENVPMQTVCKMLRLLREHKNGVDLKTALEKVEAEANQIEGVNEILKKDGDECERTVRNTINDTFTVKEDEIKSPNFASEKGAESYAVENETIWDDEGDDSLEMHLCRTMTKKLNTTDLVQNIES